MGILTAIIENWAQYHGVKAYTLRHETVTKDRLNDRIVCAPGCAVFYKFEADGEIDQSEDLEKPLFELKTNDDFADVSAMLIRSDHGTIQHAESNFVLLCDNAAQPKLYERTAENENTQFSKLFNAVLHYVKVTPVEYGDDREIVVKY